MRTKSAHRRASGPDLGTLLKKEPKLLRLLHQYGIHFCAGCYLTLSATPERAAAYHGVPDPSRFVAALERALDKRRPRRKHSRRG